MLIEPRTFIAACPSGLQCTLQLLTLLAFLLAGIQQFHESPQVYTTSLLLLPLCWLHTRKLPKQNNPPIYIALFCWYSDSNWSRKCLVGNWCFAMFFCQVTHFIVVGDLYSAFPSLGLQLYIRPSVTTHFLVLPCQPSHKQMTVQVNTFSHQDLVRRDADTTKA